MLHITSSCQIYGYHGDMGKKIPCFVENTYFIGYTK